MTTNRESIASENPTLQAEIRDLCLVAAGAIPGALLRWRLEQLWQQSHLGLAGFNPATMLVNLLGCLMIGIIMKCHPSRPKLTLVLGVGFCGSLTTFSAWILQLNQAIAEGQILVVSTTLWGNLLGGLGAVALGFWLGKHWRRIKH